MANVMLHIASAILAVLAPGVPPAPAVVQPPEQLRVMPRPADDPAPLPVPAPLDVKSHLRGADAVILSPEEYKRIIETIEQLKKQLTPEEFKKIIEHIDRLKKQLHLEMPEIPSICRVSGKVDTRGQHDVAKIRVVFEFRTTLSRTLVQLGCRKAAAVAATLDDGRLPVLQ